MLAHRGGIERMAALGGDFIRGERLDLRRGVCEIEYHEVQRRGECHITEPREIRHLSVEMRLPDGDVAEHAVEQRDRELPPPLGACSEPRRIGGEWRRECGYASTRRSMTQGAVGLKSRGPLRIGRGIGSARTRGTRERSCEAGDGGEVYCERNREVAGSGRCLPGTAPDHFSATPRITDTVQ